MGEKKKFEFFRKFGSTFFVRSIASKIGIFYFKTHSQPSLPVILYHAPPTGIIRFFDFKRHSNDRICCLERKKLECVAKKQGICDRKKGLFDRNNGKKRYFG